MNLLSFDTSSSIAAVALRFEGKDAVDFLPEGQKHAASLIPRISALMNNVSAEVSQVHALGVACGPGSFTGVRVSVSAAKGFGFASKLPLIGLNSLEVLALSAAAGKGERAVIVSMIRGRKDRVFAARFCWDQNELRPIGEAMETDPINFLRSHSGSQVCIGDGVESNSERILKEIVTEVEFSEANRKESFGHALLNLTEQKIITSNKLGIPNLEPLYLRAGGPETWDRAK